MAQPLELRLRRQLVVPRLALPDRNERVPRRAARQAAPGGAAGGCGRRGPGRVAFPSRRSSLASALPRSALEAIAPVEDEPVRWSSRGRRSSSLPRCDPAPAAETTGRVDPPRCARMVGEGDGVAARDERRLGEQCAPAGASDASGASTRAADGLARSSVPSEEERELLRRYVDAHERADVDALAELLREDAILTMPPHPTWYAGREAILIAAQKGFDPAFGHLRSVVAGATCSPRPPTTCGRRTTRRTGRWPSTCFGSKADASPRSTRSSTPSCFRRSAFRRRFDIRQPARYRTGEFLADPRFNY